MRRNEDDEMEISSWFNDRVAVRNDMRFESSTSKEGSAFSG